MRDIITLSTFRKPFENKMSENNSAEPRLSRDWNLKSSMKSEGRKSTSALSDIQEEDAFDMEVASAQTPPRSKTIKKKLRFSEVIL